MLQYYKDSGTQILIINAEDSVDLVFQHISNLANS